MGDIRLVALDLDGTLLDDRKQISPRALAAFDEAAKRGIVIAVASGRPLAAMPEILTGRAYVRYYILLNGSLVWDAMKKENLRVVGIGSEDAQAVMDELDRTEELYSCAVNGVYCMDSALYDKIEEYIPSYGPLLRIMKETRRSVPHMREWLRQDQSAVVLHISAEFRDLTLRAATMERLKTRFPRLNVVASTPRNIEINAGEAGKGEALRFLSERLAIRREEVMAFGDSLNDISMLRYAGVGVAMGNAAPEVKAAADRMTAANTEDGVARELERVLRAEK